MDPNVPLTFWEAEDDAQVVPNDLDPDRYRLLLAGRETAFGILRDPALSFPRQLAALFDLARGLERELRRGGTRQPRRWVWTMRRPLPRYGELSRCRRLAQLARVYACLELLSPDWGEALAELESFAASSKEGVRRDDARAAFAADCRQDVYPRLLFWTLYKYWLDACDDGRLLPVLRRAAAGTLLAREMNRMRYRKDGRTDPLPVISSLCRETEHNEENLQALLDAAAALPCFRDEALILLSMP